MLECVTGVLSSARSLSDRATGVRTSRAARRVTGLSPSNSFPDVRRDGSDLRSTTPLQVFGTGPGGDWD